MTQQFIQVQLKRLVEIGNYYENCVSHFSCENISWFQLLKCEDLFFLNYFNLFFNNFKV